MAVRIFLVVYYAAVLAVAFMLPFENSKYLWMRLLAIVISFSIVRYSDGVVSYLFGGAQTDSPWWVFIPLTLYFVIVFGLLFSNEYRWILRGYVWP